MDGIYIIFRLMSSNFTLLKRWQNSAPPSMPRTQHLMRWILGFCIYNSQKLTVRTWQKAGSPQKGRFNSSFNSSGTQVLLAVCFKGHGQAVSFTAPLQMALPKSPNVGQDSRPQIPELPERNVDLNGVHFLKPVWKYLKIVVDSMEFQSKT